MNSIFFSEFIQRIDQKLTEYLTGNLTNKLFEVMCYATLNGGKRIRPLLVLAGGTIAKSDYENMIEIASAIEIIHCYSLIHDDLPSMDNDDLRRGKLTAHKKFSEGFAILAGDALQSLAFTILSDSKLNISDTKKVKLINLISKSIGAYGMAGGQALDLLNTGKKSTLEQLEKMHLMKTGALIQASLLSGYIIGNIFKQNHFDILDKVASDFGLLYQIVDDILDATSNTNILGKTANKDLVNNKFTYVTYLGYDEAKIKAQYLYELINKNLSILPNNEFLIELTDYIYDRKK